MASNIFFDVDLSWTGVGQLLQIVCNVCPGFLGNLIAVTCYVSQQLLAGSRGHVIAESPVGTRTILVARARK
jgi:hypothetical protein